MSLWLAEFASRITQNFHDVSDPFGLEKLMGWGQSISFENVSAAWAFEFMFTFLYVVTPVVCVVLFLLVCAKLPFHDLSPNTLINYASQISYTLFNVLPALAIIEDTCTALPVLEPFAMDEKTKTMLPLRVEQPVFSPAVSDSELSLIRKLWTSRRSSLSAMFPGLFIYTLRALALGLPRLAQQVLPAVPALMVHLAAVALTAQLSAAWVHATITKPRSGSAHHCTMRNRIPEVGCTLRATSLPIFMDAAVAALLQLASHLAMATSVFHVAPGSWGLLAVWCNLLSDIAILGLAAILQVPTAAVLVRIQASMLPSDVETIVPVDRTFGVPDAVEERGYLSLAEAWKSFSAADWRRILKLYAKAAVIPAAWLFWMGMA